jgi:hypothetical protein
MSFIFLNATTLYPGGIRPIAPISSVAGGDDSARPRRQGKNMSLFYQRDGSFSLIPSMLQINNKI